jgi:general stress protein 26
MEDDYTATTKKLTELIKNARMAMLTTMTVDGKHVSRPMALQEAEFDGDLWFFTYENSAKVHDITLQPEVNVSFSDKNANAWVSIAGYAEVVHDRSKAEQLWNPLLKAWFPDGLDTEGLTLLRVRADSAQYWDAPNSKVANLLAMAKAAVTGDQPPKIGDSAKIDL